MYNISEYYWYDTFCHMYFNHKKKSWQQKLTPSCIYHSKESAEQDTAYFVSLEDLKLRPFLPYALAA